MEEEEEETLKTWLQGYQRRLGPPLLSDWSVITALVPPKGVFQTEAFNRFDTWSLLLLLLTRLGIYVMWECVKVDAVDVCWRLRRGREQRLEVIVFAAVEQAR